MKKKRLRCREGEKKEGKEDEFKSISSFDYHCECEITGRQNGQVWMVNKDRAGISRMQCYVFHKDVIAGTYSGLLHLPTWSSEYMGRRRV